MDEIKYTLWAKRSISWKQDKICFCSPLIKYYIINKYCEVGIQIHELLTSKGIQGSASPEAIFASRNEPQVSIVSEAFWDSEQVWMT
jgi:hypothetical protein